MQAELSRTRAAVENTDPASGVVIRLTGAALVVVLALKLFLASRLDLYSDEIFYWLASTRPALAYSDLPFMTAWLAGLGTAIGGATPLAVRLFFLVLGSSIPFVVYWLARPLTARRQAVEAALLSLCLPLGGFLGLLAVPDVPLIFFGLLALASFERALRLNHWRYWLATGTLVGLGLSTHYRFLLYPAAVVLFLCWFPAARSQWRNPRLWTAMGIAALGLAPVVWFNLSNQLASASFYLVERHPWEFQALGLLHLLKQAGLVTPPLYAVLLGTLVLMWQQARRGNQAAALLLSVALLNLLVYAVLAPWADADSTSIHWPLSGYFPLLVFVPRTLRVIYRWLGERLDAVKARQLVLAVPVLGFIGTLVALLGVGSQLWQLPLQNVLGTGVLSNKMAGWDEFAEHTRELLAKSFDETPLLITDNYYTAAQLQFAGLTGAAYTVDQDKAVRDGRLTQLRLWQMDTSALPKGQQRPFLFIVEDSTTNVIDKREVIQGMCERAIDLEHIDSLSLFNGDKQFTYYRGSALSDPARRNGRRATPCPYPMRAWIDVPAAGATVSGRFEVAGWAFSEDIGVQQVEVRIDGEVVQQTDYGLLRPDVVTAQNVRTDPNAPALGFHAVVDSIRFSNGKHELSIRITNSAGSVLDYRTRPITIENSESL